MKFKVVERFVSINGEGNHSGELAVFIRFAGCNLRCTYCDTWWANETNTAYEEMTEQEIYQYIKSVEILNVTLTGGEPLLQKDISVLLEELAADKQLRVEIETNGSVNIGAFSGIITKRPSFTMDYKLSNSGMEDRMLLENFKYLEDNDIVKFAIGSIKDMETAKAIMDRFSLLEKCSVHFSPVYGEISMETIVNYMKDNKLNGVRLQPQLHKIIWHPETRGV